MFNFLFLQGSDLHKALTDVGFTDFECTYVDRKDFYETEELIDTMVNTYNIFHNNEI